MQTYMRLRRRRCQRQPPAADSEGTGIDSDLTTRRPRARAPPLLQDRPPANAPHVGPPQPGITRAACPPAHFCLFSTRTSRAAERLPPPARSHPIPRSSAPVCGTSCRRRRGGARRRGAGAAGRRRLSAAGGGGATARRPPPRPADAASGAASLSGGARRAPLHAAPAGSGAARAAAEIGGGKEQRRAETEKCGSWSPSRSASAATRSAAASGRWRCGSTPPTTRAASTTSR
jgi:hypothetical protein